MTRNRCWHWRRRPLVSCSMQPCRHWRAGWLGIGESLKSSHDAAAMHRPCYDRASFCRIATGLIHDRVPGIASFGSPKKKVFMNFSDLGLAPGLLAAVSEKGYSVPTPIQQAAIPAVLSGRDVLAGAQTGTGKTASFVLPILQRLGTRKGIAPRALILTPTRELAAQVAESVRHYGKNTDLRSTVIFGGVGERPQIDALRRGCDILVATPGRLLDLAEQKAVSLG